MIEQADEAQLDSFQTRVAEHGRVRAILESFAYIKPFGGMFGKIVPFYAESYWYAMGGLTFLMFVFLTFSGIILALLGPYWWLTNPVGQFFKSFHYWSAQAFFFFALLHLFRVWATGSYRGRRIINWWIGLSIFMLAMGENLFGLLTRGDWESQFVSMHSDDMLFIQPFFFNLFSPANFTADLAIHIAILPVVIFGLFLAHVVSTVSRFVEQTWTSAVCAAPNQSSFPSVPSKFQEAMDSGAVQEGIQTGTCPGGPTRAPPP